jgi:hypothetical protein
VLSVQRRYLVLFICVNAVVIAYVLFYPFSSTPPVSKNPAAVSPATTNSAAVMQPPRSSASPSVGEPSFPAQTAAGAKPASAKLLAPGLAVALEYQSARDLKAFYEKYRADPAPAMKFWVAQALDTCVRFAKNPQGKSYESTDDYYQFSNEGKELADRTEAFKNMHARCNGLELRPVKDITREANELKTAAANQGDIKALAAQGLLVEDKYSDADMAKTVSKVLGSQDPYAVAEMAGLLQRPGLDYMLLGLGNQPVSYEIVDAAARLAACDLGADCSRDSVQWAAACIEQNRCSAPGVARQLLDNLDSDADRLEVKRVSQLITKAVQTGDVSLLGLPK